MDNGQQLTMFPEEQGQSAKSAEETVTVPEHKRKKKRTHDDWMSKLPVEEIEHKEEYPICENCGAEMKEIGKEKAYDELVFTPENTISAVISYIPINVRSAVNIRKIMTTKLMTLNAAISVGHTIRS